MADIILTDVTQDDVTQAEATLISLLRAEYPNLDLRRGTVLRELLVRPASVIYAADNKRYTNLENTMSLQTMLEQGITDPAAIDRVLSNFSVVRRSGEKAQGLALIRVDTARDYVISESFTVAAGTLQYVVQRAYIVSRTPAPNELQLYTSSDGLYYYFLLPVIAVEVGADYVIPQGTALELVGSLGNFISSETYNDFTGGVDAETIEQLMERLPAAISHRSLESRLSIDAILREPNQGNFQEIQALSVQGYGDSAQLRDKHNAEGVAMGGRVDIYPRTFTTPITTILQKTGQRVGPTSFRFTISTTDAPGYAVIRSIMDWGTVSTTPAAGSYDFVEVRSAQGVTDTFHDIDPANSMIEAAQTVFQAAEITVNDVAVTGDTHDFKVELYVTPRLADMQAFVDGPDVRNLKADHLVRCPFICFVSLRAQVVIRPGASVTVDKLTNDVCNYVNSRSFVDQLTESEIAAVLHQSDIIRVNMFHDPIAGFWLEGTVRDAAGKVHKMQGHSLNIRRIATPEHLLTADTCVFAADPRNMFITLLTEAV